MGPAIVNFPSKDTIDLIRGSVDLGMTGIKFQNHSLLLESLSKNSWLVDAMFDATMVPLKRMF